MKKTGGPSYLKKKKNILKISLINGDRSYFAKLFGMLREAATSKKGFLKENLASRCSV